MAIPKPGLSRFLGAAMLLALAPASRATVRPDAALSPSSRLEDLRSRVDRPDNFQRFVEGSRPRQDGSDDPRAFAPRDAGRGSKAFQSLDRPQAGLRPESAPRPPVPAADSPKTLPNENAGAELPVRGMSAVLGLGLMLMATGLIIDLLAPEPEPKPVPNESIPLAPPPAPRPMEIARAAPVKVSAPKAPFIDTRMPAPTWRAISWREQELIERWNSSREKSLGMASLTEWIGVHGSVAGVDAPSLLAKLQRSA